MECHHILYKLLVLIVINKQSISVSSSPILNVTLLFSSLWNHVLDIIILSTDKTLATLCLPDSSDLHNTLKESTLCLPMCPLKPPKQITKLSALRIISHSPFRERHQCTAIKYCHQERVARFTSTQQQTDHKMIYHKKTAFLPNFFHSVEHTHKSISAHPLQKQQQPSSHYHIPSLLPPPFHTATPSP